MEIKIIEEEYLTDEIITSEKPVLLDFFATWCGPCKMLAPTLDEIAEKENFPVYKCDVEKNHKLAEKFHIMSVPTLVIIRDGREHNRLVGVHPKDEILTALYNSMPSTI